MSEGRAAVDIDAPAFAEAKAELLAAATEEAMQAGVPGLEIPPRVAAVVKGLLALSYVNSVLTARNKPPIPLDQAPARGLAFIHLAKRSWFNQLGARYVLIKDVFEVYAGLKYARTNGDSERAYGKAQEDWLYGLLAAPRERGWTVVASSVTLSALILDLMGKEGVPPDLQQKFLLSADQWDGLPNKRAELLARAKAAPGGRTLFVSGDIHAGYASVEGGVPCLTTPAISSGTASELAMQAVAGYGLDSNSQQIKLLVALLDLLFQQANPALVLSDSKHHGVVVLEIDADAVTATYQLVPASEAPVSYLGRSDVLRGLVTTKVLKVEPGKITMVG
jgi:alkaline phosphatase D